MRPNDSGTRVRTGNELFGADSHRGYRRARFSFGYGACPGFKDRAKMMERLEPGRIGVDLSEEQQLHPEQSTDALVLYHPEAKYLNV